MEFNPKSKFLSTTSVSQKLVDLIEKNADELTKNWLREVKRDPGTPTYHDFEEDELYSRAFNVYCNLGRWISRDTTKEEIAKHYTNLGAKRYKEGFRLSEVIQALILTRRQMWLKVLADGLLDTALDLNQAIEMYTRVTSFFDRAIFFTAVGYETKEKEEYERLHVSEAHHEIRRKYRFPLPLRKRRPG